MPAGDPVIGPRHEDLTYGLTLTKQATRLGRNNLRM
jgi:hypothetical protein